jgi:hypothetical protein
MGSNPTPSTDVCLRLFCVCVVGSGLATGWSPFQGIEPTVLGLRNWSETKRFTDALCSKVGTTGKRENRSKYVSVYAWRHNLYPGFHFTVSPTCGFLHTQGYLRINWHQDILWSLSLPYYLKNAATQNGQKVALNYAVHSFMSILGAGSSWNPSPNSTLIVHMFWSVRDLSWPTNYTITLTSITHVSVIVCSWINAMVTLLTHVYSRYNS